MHQSDVNEAWCIEKENEEKDKLEKLKLLCQIVSEREKKYLVEELSLNLDLLGPPSHPSSPNHTHKPTPTPTHSHTHTHI